jgi:hypothetical protein
MDNTAPPSPIDSLGPPPFRFTLPEGSVEGPAFSRAFKALATAIVAGCAVWLVNLWLGGHLGSGGKSGLGWFSAGLLLMLWTWWHIITSRTRLDGSALHQSWVWDKRMEVRELAYGKLIRVRGLEWLIAPRLYVRTLMGKFAVFYAADPALIAEFSRLVRELDAFRRPR